MRDDLAIDRLLDLDVGPDEAAELVTTTDGWRAWLVDEVDVVIASDGTGHGTVVDDGVERTVRVDERTDRSVRFTWWETGDPTSGSEVVIRVHPDGSGSRVEIAERRLSASASTGAGVGGAARWQVRACLLSIVCTSSVRV